MVGEKPVLGVRAGGLCQAFAYRCRQSSELWHIPQRKERRGEWRGREGKCREGLRITISTLGITIPEGQNLRSARYTNSTCYLLFLVNIWEGRLAMRKFLVEPLSIKKVGQGMNKG